MSAESSINSILTGTTTAVWPSSLQPIWSQIEGQCQSLLTVSFGSIDNRVEMDWQWSFNSASNRLKRWRPSYPSSLHGVHWCASCVIVAMLNDFYKDFSCLQFQYHSTWQDSFAFWFRSLTTSQNPIVQTSCIETAVLKAANGAQKFNFKTKLSI